MYEFGNTDHVAILADMYLKKVRFENIIYSFKYLSCPILLPLRFRCKKKSAGSQRNIFLVIPLM